MLPFNNLNSESASKTVQHLPMALEAERAILYILFNVDWEVIYDIEELEPKHFALDSNQLIFNAIIQTHRRNSKIIAADSSLDKRQTFDANNVKQYLVDHKQLEAVGGVESLYDLTNDFEPNVMSVKFYVEIILSKYNERETLKTLPEIKNIINEPLEWEDKKNLIEKKLLNILSLNTYGKDKLLSPEEDGSLDQILNWINNPDDKPIYYKTGYADLDEMIMGLDPCTLNTIIGMPGTGKTILAQNLAVNYLREGIPVAFFSTEMSCNALQSRYLSIISGVPESKIKNPKQLSTEQKDKIKLAAEELKGYFYKNMYKNPLNPATISSEVRKFKRECNQEFGIVIIDYIQNTINTTTLNYNNRNRNDQLTETVEQYMSLLSATGWSIIALAQVLKSVESRSDKVPNPGDVKDCGKIIESSHNVFAVHDPSRYDREYKNSSSTLEVHVKKARTGKLGQADLLFNKEYCRLDNLSDGLSFDNIVEFKNKVLF
jgi:replicative DNA helicase